MYNLQKLGGIAALFEALAYIVGFGVMATLLNPGNTDGWSAAQKLAYVLENKTLFYAWTMVIFVAFGLMLVVLTVALHERLKDHAADLMKIATPFGFIWAGLVIASGMVSGVGLHSVAAIYPQDVTQATTTWLMINIMQDGLGGGVEIVGGSWVLLISAAIFRAKVFSKALGYLGLVVGLAGVLTVVPMLKELAMVFGLSQIVWFVWIGVLMLRQVDNDPLVGSTQ